MFIVCSEQVQSRFRAGSEYVQSMFGVCFISSFRASSVSVFEIFILFYYFASRPVFPSHFYLFSVFIFL